MNLLSASRSRNGNPTLEEAVGHLKRKLLSLSRELVVNYPKWSGKDAAAVEAVVLAAEPLSTPSREQLGRWVREGWVKWAGGLPNAKYDWVKPYEELSPAMQEADCIIGEYLLRQLNDGARLSLGKISDMVLVLREDPTCFCRWSQEKCKYYVANDHGMLIGSGTTPPEAWSEALRFVTALLKPSENGKS